MSPLGPGLLSGRFPVVASGSNAAPHRLAAKFAVDDGEIPVTRAVLRDFAVVFAGHFTAYGAIPATLAPSPGACVQVWITWLTPHQLAIMHSSEGVIGCREVEQRYDFVELDELDLHHDHMSPPTKAGAYLSRRMLAPHGHPIRFAEMPSKNCTLKALPERAVLRLAHQLLDREASFSTFMSRVLSHRAERQTLFQKLTAHTIERQEE